MSEIKSAYAPQKQRDIAVNTAFAELAAAVFRMACHDASNPSAPSKLRKEAQSWLENSGYKYLTGLLGLEISATDYIELINRTQEATKPIMYLEIGTNGQNRHGLKTQKGAVRLQHMMFDY